MLHRAPPPRRAWCRPMKHPGRRPMKHQTAPSPSWARRRLMRQRTAPSTRHRTAPSAARRRSPTRTPRSAGTVAPSRSRRPFRRGTAGGPDLARRPALRRRLSGSAPSARGRASGPGAPRARPEWRLQGKTQPTAHAAAAALGPGFGRVRRPCTGTF